MGEGETTSKKTILVTEDLIHVPKEKIKLHRDIVMTSEIFFVHTIPFFLTLSRNFFFTMVHHLTESRAKNIYTTLNEVYIYHRKN